MATFGWVLRSVPLFLTPWYHVLECKRLIYFVAVEFDKGMALNVVTVLFKTLRKKYQSSCSDWDLRCDVTKFDGVETLSSTVIKVPLISVDHKNYEYELPKHGTQARGDASTMLSPAHFF